MLHRVCGMICTHAFCDGHQLNVRRLCVAPFPRVVQAEGGSAKGHGRREGGDGKGARPDQRHAPGEARRGNEGACGTPPTTHEPEGSLTARALPPTRPPPRPHSACMCASIEPDTCDTPDPGCVVAVQVRRDNKEKAAAKLKATKEKAEQARVAEVARRTKAKEETRLQMEKLVTVMRCSLSHGSINVFRIAQCRPASHLLCVWAFCCSPWEVCD